MDDATLSAYDRDAKAFANDWDAQPPPSDLHAVVRQFFIPGPTADVGCGSGRDAAWLNACGYPTTGFDASEGLLPRRGGGIRRSILARPSFRPRWHCRKQLCQRPLRDRHYASRARSDHASGRAASGHPCSRRILYLSWRVTEGADRRDEHGRLYAAFEPERVLRALTATQVLLDEQVGSVSSGKLIRRIVARKQSAEN